MRVRENVRIVSSLQMRLLLRRKQFYEQKKQKEMDFIKKNSAWIALAGLCLSVFIYYKVFMTKEEGSSSTGSGQAGFSGKIGVGNPINL